jgi:hypothetical protein
LALVLLKGLIVGRFGLQGGQLVFGGGQFAAGQTLLQLCDGRARASGASVAAGGVLWQAPSSTENATRSR